jgi:hypothetical protein
MQRGFTKAWRKELDSDIWLMPPVYHRVWYWLRLKAQHEEYLFPTRKLFGIWVLPGQRLTSIQEIANGVRWFDNHREITPDKRTIVRVLEWLEFHDAITFTCNTYGTIITIINWDIYNHVEAEPVTIDTPRNVYKKRMYKNNNKESNDSLLSLPENENDWISKKGRRLEGKRFEAFQQFWDAFAYKDGRAAAIDAWLDIPQLTNTLVQKIITAAKKEAVRRTEILRKGGTPKMAQGWITERRWEDETHAETVAPATLPIADEETIQRLRATREQYGC